MLRTLALLAAAASHSHLWSSSRSSESSPTSPLPSAHAAEPNLNAYFSNVAETGRELSRPLAPGDDPNSNLNQVPGQTSKAFLKIVPGKILGKAKKNGNDKKKKGKNAAPLTAKENSGGSFIRAVSVYFASPLDEALASVELLLPPGYLVKKHKLITPGSQEFLDHAMRDDLKVTDVGPVPMWAMR